MKVAFLLSHEGQRSVFRCETMRRCRPPVEMDVMRGTTKAAVLGAAMAAAVLAAPRAEAALLLSTGASTTVQLSGTVASTSLSATAQINITSFSASQIVAAFTLTNTTPNLAGQNRLVSFGFDLTPSGNRNVTAVVSGNSDWGVTEPDAIPGFGAVDICAWDGQNCSGGGSQGIGEGLSESFTLTITGVFSNPLSMDNFAARFQSIGSGGASGFITETTNGPGPGPTPVPEPMTLALLGAGLAGLGLARRRRRA
jgi:hypothetical protein